MILEIDGARIACDDRGSGPAVLLLHAFPLHAAMWDETVATLSAGHRTVRFDVRGFGGSSPAEGTLTMDRIADDAVCVLDRLGIARAVVCGCSMGGYAAFALARRHPGRLAGLALVDTRAIPDSDDARAGRAQLAARVTRDGPAALRDAMLTRLLGVTSLRERPEVVARVEAMMMACAPAAVASSLAGLAARPDSRPTLAEIRVPTLVVRGLEDGILPAGEAVAMTQAIPGARLATIYAAGHLPSLENPSLFGATVLDWLATLPPTG